jgi:NAD(P)-dependent dehydrogenase (short-subunit alcohol dehydrogenase family)
MHLPPGLQSLTESDLRNQGYRIDLDSSPNLLVIGAGLYVQQSKFMESEPKTWLAEVSSSLTELFSAVQKASAEMKTLGGGRIVILTNDCGIRGRRDFSAAAAISGAVISTTRGFARELAPAGIIVNTVCCDSTNFAVNDNGEHEADEVRDKATSAATLFVSDPTLKSLVGQVIVCNAGRTRSRP